jgi:hypothetical protein
VSQRAKFQVSFHRSFVYLACHTYRNNISLETYKKLAIWLTQNHCDIEITVGEIIDKTKTENAVKNDKADNLFKLSSLLV